MNILVTAGNTWAPVDKVRVLTNIFTGKTGTTIALEAHRRGHAITLLTSHPEIIKANKTLAERWQSSPYRTFDELGELMKTRIAGGAFDAVIHSAAVSDYVAGGIYAPEPSLLFDATTGEWQVPPERKPAFIPRKAQKIKSDDPELWLRLVRAPKLVDKIRREWGFANILVKFKLEVATDDSALMDVAERSRLQSAADLMVANTLEGAGSWAYFGPVSGEYHRVEREKLASRLLDAVEHLHKERHHG